MKPGYSVHSALTLGVTVLLLLLLGLSYRDALTSGRQASLDSARASIVRQAEMLALVTQDSLQDHPTRVAAELSAVSARLMALANVYDALASRRVYKPAFPHDKSAAIIVEGRGQHFDPDVVDAFLAVQQQFQDIAARFVDAE